MWFFTIPNKLIFGQDALDALTEELADTNKIFIVTDKIICNLGLLELITSKIKDKQFHVFDEVEPEPSIETVQQGTKVCQAFEPEWILAVGGGSVIDTAKGIWFLYERPDLDLISGLNVLDKYGLGQKAQLAAIPTTSGTGSEASWFIILSDKTEKRKISLHSKEIIPHLSIIDPLLAAKMPKQLTICTGLDALTHAIESFVGAWNNDFSDAFSIRASQLIFKFLPRAVAEGSNDMFAREKLHNAATMAGVALSNSNLSIAHSMGHAIGAIFEIPHGIAVSIALIYCLEFLVEKARDRLVELGNNLGYKSAEMLIKGIKDLIESIDAPTKFADVVSSKSEFLDHLNRLVELSREEPLTLISLREPTREEFEKLFLYAYEGKKVDF